MVENKNAGFMDVSSDRESPSTLGGDEIMVHATAVPTSQDTVLYSPEGSNNNATSLDGVETTTNGTTDNDNTDDARMVGAGVAGGVVGLLFGGPILGALTGFGTAWATTKTSPAGDVARAMGDVALTARDKARELNHKHNFTQQSQQAATRAVERVQEYERQHNVVAKTREFLEFSWTKIADFNREHRVVERAVQKVGDAVSFLVKKLVGGDEDANNSTNHRDYNAVPSDAAPKPSAPVEWTTCEAQPF